MSNKRFRTDNYAASSSAPRDDDDLQYGTARLNNLGRAVPDSAFVGSVLAEDDDGGALAMDTDQPSLADLARIAEMNREDSDSVAGAAAHAAAGNGPYKPAPDRPPIQEYADLKQKALGEFENLDAKYTADKNRPYYRAEVIERAFKRLKNGVLSLKAQARQRLRRTAGKKKKSKKAVNLDEI